MEELTGLLRNALVNAEFGDAPARRVSAEKLRSLYVAGERLRIYEKTVCRADTLAPLAAHLQKRLEAYANEDMDKHCGLVGYGVDYVRGVVTRRSVEDIALLLVRAAVLLTPEPAAAIFSGWLDGQPIRYKVVGLVDGLSVNEPLALENGIEVRRASRWLPPIPGNVVIARLPQERRAGSAEVSFDVSAQPAFFRYEDPMEYGAGGKVIHTWAGGDFSTSMLHDFCEALSLSCNRCVRPVDVWQDDGDTAAFCDGSSSLPWRRIRATESSVATPLTQEMLEGAWKIYRMRQSVLKVKSTVDVTVERWVNSKQQESSLRDKLIELRVALEVLFLDNAQGESRFRLAMHGAWLLGASVEERDRYYDALLRAYGAGSTAVHGGEVSAKHKEQLTAGQELCRDGILKMLRLGHTPEWRTLVLGKAP